MQAIENFRNSIKKLAAGTHGQVANVRTFMGRQVVMLDKSSQVFMLPYIQSVPLQDTDPESETFGEFFNMVDHDGVDEGIIF